MHICVHGHLHDMYVINTFKYVQLTTRPNKYVQLSTSPNKYGLKYVSTYLNNFLLLNIFSWSLVYTLSKFPAKIIQHSDGSNSIIFITL